MTGKVLLIVIDQFRADCLNGALAGAVDLPNLRALMRESVTFNRHHTVTTPCGPSRASLLTGLYAMNHRSIHNGTPLEEHHTTIGTEIRKAGYEPMLFGYTDISADPNRRHPNDPDLKTYGGVAPGFAEIVRMRNDSNSSWLGYLKARGYALPEEYWDMFRPVSASGLNQPEISDPAMYSAEDSDTAFLTGRTIQELSAREHVDWFAMVTYLRPHPPLVAPAPYNKMYAPADTPPPFRPPSLAAHNGTHPFFSADLSEAQNFELFSAFDGHIDRLSDGQTAELRSVYFGLATEVDAHIGRLLDFLKTSGQYDDTLVVVTADHGEMLGDHFMWGKTAMFEPALHVPLIIRDPTRRETAGTVVNQFTESIDVAPTLLDWVGLPSPFGFNGHSLLPFIDGQAPQDWRKHIFAEVNLGDPVNPTRFQKALGLPAARCGFALLRDERYKYVHFNGGLPPLLYDMGADPVESANLAGEPDHAADLLRLAGQMLDHRMTHAHHSASRMKLTSQGVQSG